MKYFKLTAIALLASIMLTACGGANSNNIANDTTTLSNPTIINNSSTPSKDSVALIIDNGRGTTNNQETEKP